MIPIARIVKKIVEDSEVVSTALRDKYLNLTAFAKQSQKKVATLAKKPVQLGSIVIALSRLQKELVRQKALPYQFVPKVILENIVVKSGLVEITLERTMENVKCVQKIYARQSVNAQDFFMLSQGIGEITLITTEEHNKDIDKILRERKRKAEIHNLVSVSITFTQKQLHLPNIIFALVRSLALKQINIIEIVSTRSELAFIVHQSELQSTFTTMNEIYQEGLQELSRG